MKARAYKGTRDTYIVERQLLSLPKLNASRIPFQKVAAPPRPVDPTPILSEKLTQECTCRQILPLFLANPKILHQSPLSMDMRLIRQLPSHPTVIGCTAGDSIMGNPINYLPP